MTLADERLRELDNAPPADGERVLMRCGVAADLIHKGRYEAASEALGELWPGVGERPSTAGWPPAVEAELLLRCGALSGWLGNARNAPCAQERAKDMLSEAARTFGALGMASKVSEAQYELGICYWRVGAYGEARLILGEALKPLRDAEVELKAKILIRSAIVETCENKFYEALSVLKAARPVFDSANDALKGRWHGEMGLVLARLASVEGQAEHNDRAIIEFTAAIYHYEQAGHERYCAINRNNVAMLLYKLGRCRDAHEHLDRARAALSRLGDEGLLAQVDETRARVFIEEKKYAEADGVIERAVRSLEKGSASAYLSDALTVRGVARARLGADEESINLLRRAVKVAEEAGAYTNAGLAALTLIEEHGAGGVLPQGELYSLYCRADEFLRQTQDAEDVRRLRECACVVMRRLADAQVHDENFSFYGAVQEFEAKLIEQALEESGGSVTGASKLLGLKHQTLISMLETRHRGLCEKRRPPEKRLRSIVRKDC